MERKRGNSNKKSATKSAPEQPTPAAAQTTVSPMLLPWLL